MNPRRATARLHGSTMRHTRDLPEFEVPQPSNDAGRLMVPILSIEPRRSVCEGLRRGLG